MDLKSVTETDIYNTILECYTSDPSIQEFSRNSEHGVEGRTKLEADGLKLADPSFQFYRILDNDKFVGYFGTESKPVNCLTTFFIMPEYRSQKDEVWKFIASHMPDRFFAGLFKVNKRAIRFYQNNGGKIIGEVDAEGKPSVVFWFER